MDNKYPIGGYAPGSYRNTCCTCGNQFTGDKRAVQCEPCAIKDKEAFEALSPDEQEALIKKNVAMLKDWRTFTTEKSALPPLDEPILTDKDVKDWDEMKKSERAPQGAVWVKASERLPGLKTPVKWRQGEIEMKVKPVWYMVLDTNSVYLSKCEWLDESAGEKEVTP